MSWLKIDDQFPHHPKLVSISIPARWAYMEGLCYCAQYLTDGFIADGQARLIASPKVRAELLEAVLWHEVKGGISVHDYLDYNPTKAQVMAEREAARKRKFGRSSDEPSANYNRTLREVQATYG